METENRARTHPLCRLPPASDTTHCGQRGLAVKQAGHLLRAPSMTKTCHLWSPNTLQMTSRQAFNIYIYLCFPACKHGVSRSRQSPLLTYRNNCIHFSRLNSPPPGLLQWMQREVLLRGGWVLKRGSRELHSTHQRGRETSPPPCVCTYSLWEEKGKVPKFLPFRI